MVFPDRKQLFASEVNLCPYPWRLELCVVLNVPPLFPATKDQVSNKANEGKQKGYKKLLISQSQSSCYFGPMML